MKQIKLLVEFYFSVSDNLDADESEMSIEIDKQHIKVKGFDSYSKPIEIPVDEIEYETIDLEDLF